MDETDREPKYLKKPVLKAQKNSASQSPSERGSEERNGNRTLQSDQDPCSAWPILIRRKAQDQIKQINEKQEKLFSRSVSSLSSAHPKPTAVLDVHSNTA